MYDPNEEWNIQPCQMTRIHLRHPHIACAFFMSLREWNLVWFSKQWRDFYHTFDHPCTLAGRRVPAKDGRHTLQNTCACRSTIFHRRRRKKKTVTSHEDQVPPPAHAFHTGTPTLRHFPIQVRTWKLWWIQDETRSTFLTCIPFCIHNASMKSDLDPTGSPAILYGVIISTVHDRWRLMPRLFVMFCIQIYRYFNFAPQILPHHIFHSYSIHIFIILLGYAIFTIVLKKTHFCSIINSFTYTLCLSTTHPICIL